MSKFDETFKETCKQILSNGYDDCNETVRPKWEDGTPAHTKKTFAVINRYDLREEFPACTLRPLYLKSAVDELLWIYQKKSNNVNELSSKIWDSWADKTGSIGKAYGYQMGIKHKYKEGEFDQVDRAIYDLKNNKASRSIITNTYNHADLSEMNLRPCAYSMTFNASGNTLNGLLNQRSQDMLTANCWNVAQYSVFLIMMAQVTGFEPGELVHVIADAHIYDRHIPLVERLLEEEGYPAPIFWIDESITDFYDFRPGSVKLENYKVNAYGKKLKIPVAV